MCSVIFLYIIVHQEIWGLWGPLVGYQPFVVALLVYVHSYSLSGAILNGERSIKDQRDETSEDFAWYFSHHHQLCAGERMGRYHRMGTAHRRETGQGSTEGLKRPELGRVNPLTWYVLTILWILGHYPVLLYVQPFLGRSEPAVQYISSE